MGTSATRLSQQQTVVNMTKHGVQSERKLKTVQLMMLSVIIDVI
ncbi:hypothetical protein T07_13378 [Trichinella nelsoni]|uniref:Uncharacterized protein n=1 Tax=Trichinella nelsoni TaxID=6336 RepID=A0A0V0RC92_9BILA|nr:hypothetical protein T07_13378 [Trichinella nelsoni]